jgi:hypothetical protein
MTRRCKPGQRARIIGRSTNVGKIVLVVRHYLGELVNNANWPENVFPWVVTSLGGALESRNIRTGLPCPLAMTIVVDDGDLEPLNDDDDEVWEAEGADLLRGAP